jgi:hypothetical protein
MSANPSPSNKPRASCALWIHKAFKAVNGAYPSVDWTRQSPEITEAEKKLDFYLGAYFYSQFERPTVTLEDVRDAWRRYYQLHL